MDVELVPTSQVGELFVHLAPLVNELSRSMDVFSIFFQFVFSDQWMIFPYFPMHIPDQWMTFPRFPEIFHIFLRDQWIRSTSFRIRGVFRWGSLRWLFFRCTQPHRAGGRRWTGWERWSGWGIHDIHSPQKRMSWSRVFPVKIDASLKIQRPR